MAEALNYRMNLVIDPKNVIRANRELRAMERYFERIQGRVLKIGRTRMVPEIVLKDRASGRLDSLLDKIHQVKSEIIHASGSVKMKVEESFTVKCEPLTMPNTTPDMSPLVDALKENTDAVNLLTSALGSLQVGGGSGGGEQPKNWLDNVKDFLTDIKAISGGVKSVGSVPGKYKKLKNVWNDVDSDDKKKPGKKNNSRKNKKSKKGKKRGKQKSPNKNKAADVAVKKPKMTVPKLFKLAEAGGDLVETVASGGIGLIDGIRGLSKHTKGLFKGGSAGVSASSSIVAGNAASKTTSKVATKGGGLLSKVLKTGIKRGLGPLSLIPDAVAIATAKPGKERAQAVGSAVGGSIGTSVGMALGTMINPAFGTWVGGTLGGMAGDYIGGKIGGWVSDQAPKIKGWFSKNILGKKDKPQDDIAKKPAVMRSPTVSSNQSAAAIGPTVPSGNLFKGLGDSAKLGSMSIPSQRVQAAVADKPSPATGKTIPQLVQITPEQMTALSGFLRDFKTETTNQYNLPPGAVQVTVHQEESVDVEELIQQIGQRLRAEFQKASQNQKPVQRAYAY